jgi:glycosyltransferase involved in cell wall biosynthesis
MIYLDVTSATASPINMGVQRTIRGLHTLLKIRPDVVPLRWDFFRKQYSRLSAREQGFLDHPFATYQQAEGTPGRWDWRHLLSNWRDDWNRGRRSIPDREILREGNTLLIPDLCWDQRIRAWSRFATLPGRKIAVFHDAMPLRIPGQADSHDALFANYVRNLAQLDLVICISQEVEDDLSFYWKKFGLAPKPTRVLAWPIPFAPPRPNNPPNQSARQIIYVARLKLRKNHLVLLDACESLWNAGENFRLDLIGIADAFSDTQKILRRVRQLSNRGRPVCWRKHISDAELAIGEGAQGGGCYQIDQNDPAELADAIRLLLSNSALYQRLYAEAGARTFRQWDDYEKDLASVLKSAVFSPR